MFNLSKVVSFVLATLLASSVAVTAGNVPETDKPIIVVMNEWTGQHISAKMSGALLQKMGYNIEYVSAGSLPQHAGIAQGNLHFSAEIWTNNVGDLYPKMVESGEIIVIGDIGLDPREGWIYPPYMEEKCPGLPSYKALYDCAQAFATAETFPNGRLITYPADWGTRSKDIVAGIDLPFKAVAGGSEGAMIAELKSAMATKSPILSMMWQPHWLFAEHDFNWIEWNPIDGECIEENQEKDTACGFSQARVKKVVWSGFEGTWPAAFKMLSMMTFTNATQNAGILEVDNKGRDIHDVVDEWLANNEATWQPWIAAAMK